MTYSDIEAKNRESAKKAFYEGCEAFENNAKLADNPHKAPISKSAWFAGFEESLRRYSLGLPKLLKS